MSVFLTAGMVFVFIFCGTLLILRQHAIKLVLGLGLLGHAFNLILFGTTRLTDGAEPIIDKSRIADPEYWATQAFADPLPHALILTAIVIGFGLTAYLIALLQRLHEVEPLPSPDRTRESDHYHPYLGVERFDPAAQSAPEDYLQLDEIGSLPPISHPGPESPT